MARPTLSPVTDHTGYRSFHHTGATEFGHTGVTGLTEFATPTTGQLAVEVIEATSRRCEANWPVVGVAPPVYSVTPV
jgi:hypothetical protein